MKKMKVAELIEDFDLYPRNNVDSQNVRTIINAIIAGAEIPPIIICKKSKRVVDGFHRRRAYLQHFGTDAEIEVIEKTYKDDGALFLDSMRYNAGHGARLDPCDRTHCVIVAERLGLSLDAVAGALHMPVGRLGALKADRTATSGGLAVALKRTVHNFAGKELTERQTQANEKLSGMNQVFYVNQVIELIESDMLERESDDLFVRLKHLHGLLDELLAVK